MRDCVFVNKYSFNSSFTLKTIDVMNAWLLIYYIQSFSMFLFLIVLSDFSIVLIQSFLALKAGVKTS